MNVKKSYPGQISFGDLSLIKELGSVPSTDTRVIFGFTLFLPLNVLSINENFWGKKEYILAYKKELG